MRDWYAVVEVQARPNFRVWLRFEDGLEGEADLSDVAGRGVFRRWIDHPEEFSQVKVDPPSRTIVWPGGLDVAPDRLYDEVARFTREARR
ncbi:MAG: DUF2442 domain-containing protein [Gemmatimonadales bacterium]|jgi:hypothetical protein